jgi:ABC-2 type transport system ATP-binding protein
VLQGEAAARFEGAAYRDWCGQKGLKMGQRFGALSKGQKRWVLCGLAVASRPAVLLMDEPADGLDTAARRSLYDAVRQHATREDSAVVVATHLLGDIERVADEAVILDGGRVRLAGALEDLREEVREVEWTGEGPFDAEARGLRVLARRLEGGVQRVWVRGSGGVALSGARTVGLEELYLALTEPGDLADGKLEAVS